MTITVISVKGCNQCKTAKMLLTKKKLKFTEIVHDKHEHDDYPIIYIDTKRFCYRDFLKKMRE